MRYYSKNDEWIDVAGSLGTIGITAEGVAKLGEVSFVELPRVGVRVTQGETLCTVESVKAAVDLFAPMSGTVRKINAQLVDQPQLLGETTDSGWIAVIEITDSAESNDLMNEDAYRAFVSEA